MDLGALRVNQDYKATCKLAGKATVRTLPPMINKAVPSPYLLKKNTACLSTS